MLGVAHPGFLEYKAFDSQDQTLVFDELGLRRVAPPSGADVVADLEHRLLATARETTGLGSLEYDDDRDIGFVHGRIGVLVSLVGNPARVRLRALMVTDVPAWPFVPERIERALEEFCQICDALNDLLQAEFGGDSLVNERTPSATRH